MLTQISRWLGDPVDGHSDYFLNRIELEGVLTYGIRRIGGEGDAYIRIEEGRDYAAAFWHFTLEGDSDHAETRFTTQERAVRTFAGRMNLAVDDTLRNFGLTAETSNPYEEIATATSSGDPFTLHYFPDQARYGVCKGGTNVYLADEGAEGTRWFDISLPVNGIPQLSCLFVSLERLYTAFSNRRGDVSVEQARAAFGDPQHQRGSDPSTTTDSQPEGRPPFTPFNLEIKSPEEAILIHLMMRHTRSPDAAKWVEEGFPGGTAYMEQARRTGIMDITGLRAELSSSMSHQGLSLTNLPKLTRQLVTVELVKTLGCNNITYYPGYMVSTGSGTTNNLTTEQLDLMAERCAGGYLTVDNHNITSDQVKRMADECRRLTTEQEVAA